MTEITSHIEFKKLQKRYFSGETVTSEDLDRFVLAAINIDSNWQKHLLEQIIRHPLILKYPLKSSYQRKFMKNLISKLENLEFEILDEIYEHFCEVVQCASVESDIVYKHYIIGVNSTAVISMQEHRQIISEGTTGLCTWQGSKVLAEWCLNHFDFLQKKHILELGSGIGLTGLTIIKNCDLNSYWFSDIHPSVLELLKSNILLNLIGIEKTSSDQIEEELSLKIQTQNFDIRKEFTFRGNFQDTQVNVIRLPWEKVVESNILEYTKPDVILASDVVYDRGIFPALCSAFSYFLTLLKCTIIIACTERNELTLNEFITILRLNKMEIFEENFMSSQLFICSDDTPVRVFKIKLAKSNS